MRIVAIIIIMYLICAFILMEINAYYWTVRAMYVVVCVGVIEIMYKVYDARIR